MTDRTTPPFGSLRHSRTRPAWICAVLLALSWPAFAQDAPAPTPPEASTAPAPAASEGTVPEERWLDRVILEGLVDAFYSHRLEGEPRSDSALRVFEASNGTFVPAYAELAAALKVGSAGLRIDLGFGPVADLSAPQDLVLDPLDPATTRLVPNETFKHLQQAYASFTFPGGVPVTLDFGKFVTTAGAEVIEAKANMNYSRSLLFGFALPFTHTGLRVTAPLTETFSLQASLVNGWDVVNDNNKYKTLGLSGAFTSPGGTAVLLTYYGGPEGTTSDWRHLVDAVVSQKLGDALTVALNGDYGTESGNSWYGVAAYVELKPAERLRFALRGEYFGDPDRYRLGGQTDAAWEVTATAGLGVGENAELRLELRHDQAPEPVFRGGASESQSTLQLAALAWF